jgi:anti-sigma B factor antagonist
MPEKREALYSPAADLPAWAALAGGTPGQLAWSVYADSHLVVAALDGELDIATQPGLAQELDPLAAAGRHLILDLGALTFCDCTGLNLFVRWQRQAVAAGGVLHIVGASPRFRQLAGLAAAGGLLQAARPCLHQCCLGSHPELRAAAGEPI